MSTGTQDAALRDSDEDAVLTVARFEGHNRLRVTAVLAVLFALFGALYIWVGPQVVDAGFSEIVDAMPAAVTELFGFESLESIEGLLASEFYTLGWMVGLAGYLAYSAAGTVAGDLRDERMDTLLSGPVSRQSVLFGKFLALLVPILALNVAVPLVLYGMSVLVGEQLSLGDLVVLHALSIPYLLFWSAAGLLLGVVVRRGRTAGRVALGLVFFGWLFEAVISTTDVAWLGRVSPMQYFNPPEVLVAGTYDVVGSALLLAGTLVALALGMVWFRWRDL